MTASLELFRQFGEALAPFALIGGGVYGLWTYGRATRVRRAEWLVSLYDKFYEAPTYKRVRWILDYTPDAELTKLKHAIAGGGDDELAEAFVDYRNFFELVASLCTLKQIPEKEIAMLFDYYLGNLDKHDFVRDFVAKEGFENLYALLHRRRASARNFPR